MFRIGRSGTSDDDQEGGHRIRLGGGRFTLPAWLFYPFVALLSLWVFVYISGLFPYLGYKSGGHQTLPGPVGRVSYGIGDNDHMQAHRIFLFAGQTAIIDYDVSVRKGQLKISVQEGFLPVGPKLVEQGIAATSTGRVAVKVPNTGIYTIYFRPTYRLDTPDTAADVSYTLWWGGLFG
jgi:hypothetical protein